MKKKKKMAVCEKSLTLLSAFTLLFYFSKILGIIPHSFSKFYKYKILISSNFGIVWSLISLFYNSIQYHVFSETLSLSDQKEGEKQSKYL